MKRHSVTNSLQAKLYEINWFLITLIYVIGLIGVITIYAATDGVWSQGAAQHFYRLLICGGILFVIALVDIKIWYRLAYPIFLFSLGLLMAVEFWGYSVQGAQRWLELGIVRLQPSELSKIALILALARFYNDLDAALVSRIIPIVIAIILILLPVQFIWRQPDLGTALMLLASGMAIIFLAGINWKVIVHTSFALLIITPLFLRFGLQDYQRVRILTFFDRTNDLSGADYHITQSKIALGSGGISGKGFMNGTQRQLAYVPENRTDFIFTVIGEEFGFMGGMIVLLLYGALLGLSIRMALQCKHLFSQLLILGLTVTIALYIFINLAMVMGLVPVVGVPLPLISFGGTVVLTLMCGFGLMLSAHLHRHSELPLGSGRPLP